MFEHVGLYVASYFYAFTSMSHEVKIQSILDVFANHENALWSKSIFQITEKIYYTTHQYGRILSTTPQSKHSTIHTKKHVEVINQFQKQNIVVLYFQTKLQILTRLFQILHQQKHVCYILKQKLNQQLIYCLAHGCYFTKTH